MTKKLYKKKAKVCGMGAKFFTVSLKTRINLKFDLIFFFFFFGRPRKGKLFGNHLNKKEKTNKYKKMMLRYTRI